MGAPTNEVIQMEYRNPDASSPLFVPVLVICNTPDEVLARNITTNSAKNLKWLKAEKPTDLVAVMVGGGSSIVDELDKIKELQNQGAVVFAMNAASQWLYDHGVSVDYQCIVDAKEETASLIDHWAKNHIFGSQVAPVTMDSVHNPIVCHLEIGDVEQFFPKERKEKGGYVLLGGGAAVGNSALCAAYAGGFREFHIFGYDSCHKNGNSHAYPQDMNIFIPTVEVEWGGKTYTSSVAMKAQAERFQFTSKALKEKGCEIYVYGDGLLQSMYHTKPKDLTEQQKYQLMWQFDVYREASPGECIADFFVTSFFPDGLVIDYGCGTGRASLRMVDRGVDVLLMDFADNCRDEEALSLPFVQWDLTKKIPTSSPYGFCSDVMEHIPTGDVADVLCNILNASEQVFFQISTVPDEMGEAIDATLHLTVKPHIWWKQLFEALGFSVDWDSDEGDTSLFYIVNIGEQNAC